ncbi:MAG: thiamine phosphate synthase [Nitrospirae bacterium]|nr:MAG: thiamine phosphate synthase [Nitrospirota bacterium]
MPQRVVPSRACSDGTACRMGHVVLPSLYLITDRRQTHGRSLEDILASVSPIGGFMLQLRERDLQTRALLQLARSIQELTKTYQIPFLVNDRVDLAVALDLHGVHLRSDSLPIRQARRCLRSWQLLGFSGHSVADMVSGEEEGADFGVIGPIFDTPSKRPYGPPLGLAVLEEASRRCRIPLYAVGGVTPQRVKDVKQAGAYGVAVIRAVFSEASPAEALQQFATSLGVANTLAEGSFHAGGETDAG